MRNRSTDELFGAVYCIVRILQTVLFSVMVRRFFVRMSLQLI